MTTLDPTPPKSLWTLYHLSGDPFFANELAVSDSAAYSVKKFFRARSEERERLGRMLASNGRTGALLYAAGGFGKSTLAASVARDIREAKFLVLDEDIDIQNTPDFPTFFNQLLVNILLQLQVEGVTLPEAPKDAKDHKVKLKWLLQARTRVNLTRRLASTEIGVTALVGANAALGYEHIQPAFDAGPSKQLLAGVLEEIKTEEDYVGIVVRVENLDAMLPAHKQKLEDWLNQARDFLTVTGMHFLLMGNAEVHAQMSANTRVRGAFNYIQKVEALKYEDVGEILQARYRHLAFDEGWIPPVDQELVRHLYDVHHGDIRNILADLSRCVGMLNIVEAKPIMKTEVLPGLEALDYESLQPKCTKADWQFLTVLVGLPPNFTEDDVFAKGVAEEEARSKLTRLSEVGAIEPVYMEAGRMVYRVRGRGSLAQREAHRRKLC